MRAMSERSAAGIGPRPDGQMTFLIAYDIRDPARLRRVHARIIRDGVRLHFSLYAADLGESAHASLLADLARLIDPACDDVRIYPVPDPPRGARLGPQQMADDLLLFGSPAASLAARLAAQHP